MSPAKFKVGEIVQVFGSVNTSKLIYSDVMIIERRWYETQPCDSVGPSGHRKTFEIYTGWIYTHDCSQDCKALERQLRRRPPPADQAWEKFNRQLNLQGLVT